MNDLIARELQAAKIKYPQNDLTALSFVFAVQKQLSDLGRARTVEEAKREVAQIGALCERFLEK